MYNNKILEIFKNPTNAGGLQGSNGLGKYVDEVCGDCVKIYLKINESGIIEEARFKTMGSVGTIVASSVICSLVTDMSVEEAKTLSKQDVLNETGDYPQDKHYSINFALKALLLAIEDYYSSLVDEPKKRGRKPKGEEKQETKNLFSSLVEEDYLGEMDELSQEDVEETSEPFDEDYAMSDDAQQEQVRDDIDSKEELLAEEYTEKVVVETQNEDTYYDDFEDELLFGEYDAFNELTNKQTKENKSKNAKKAKDISEELDGLRATKILEESKSYVPVIETKIISDEELAKKQPKTEAKEEKTESSKSSAKALFDSMFED